MNKASVEQSLLAIAVVGAITFCLIGVWFASEFADAHWVNRAGAAVLALEAFLLLLEFRMKTRFSEIESRVRGRNRYLAIEIRRAEVRVLTVTVLLAALGEILHGFGDLIAIAIAPQLFSH